MTDTDGESDQSPKRAKRQKISVACMECRSKKVRCDGQRPVCGPCLKKYGSGAHCRLRLTAAQELAALHSQIADLGGKVDDIQSNDVQRYSIARSLPGAATPSPSGALNDRLGSVQRTQHGHYGVPLRKLASSAMTDEPHEYADEEGVDAMVGATTHAPPTDQAFFGASSASGFIRQVRRSLNTHKQPPEALLCEPLQHHQTHPAFTPESDQTVSWTEIKMPARSVADNLVQIYWRIVHPLYPFLDRNTVQDSYHELWTEHARQGLPKSFLCQINVIFALTCQLDENIEPEQRLASSEIYINRAKRELNSDLWEQASLPSVQNFLLLSQYLQSTNKAYQCWMAVGQAIRMAQNLGLHLPDTTEKINSPRRQQLCRKVWHGCILMDRIVAMTYGRPIMIATQAASVMPLPIALDDEFIADDPRAGSFQRAEGPMLIDFFIHTLTLYELMGRILTIFYSNDEQSRPSARASEITSVSTEVEATAVMLELDQSLLSWVSNVPAHLRKVNQQSDAAVFRRQANILHSRYLHVRILLHRPALSNLVAAQDSYQQRRAVSDSTLAAYLRYQSSVMCVQAAVDAIQHMKDRLPVSISAIGSLPAWWYNVLYIYTAATVLLAAFRSPTLKEHFHSEHILESWRSAVFVLRRYRTFSSSVRKSITALEMLFDQITPQDLGTTERPDTRPQTTATPNRKLQHNAPVMEQRQSSPNGLDRWENHAQLLPLTTQQAGAIPFAPATTSQPDPSMAYGDPRMPVDPDLATGDDSLDRVWSQENFDIAFDISDLSWLNSLPHNL